MRAIVRGVLNVAIKIAWIDLFVKSMKYVNKITK